METDWKKKYNEALNKARELNGTVAAGRDFLAEIFPELRESEDERIRKWLYDYISNCPNNNFAFYGGVGKDAVLNYLKKQKETLHIPETCKENADSFTDEDERTRKYIVNFVELNKGTNLSPDDADRMLAYLERQKAQKPTAKVNGEPISAENQSVDIPLAEWSEEDEDNLRRVTRIIEDNDSDWKELTDWLKSLRPPQYCENCKLKRSVEGWKPSEEQMKELELIINGKAVIRTDFIRTLYNDLKKL